MKNEDKYKREKLKYMAIITFVLLIFITVITLQLIGNYIFTRTNEYEIILYKTPECTCCSSYIKYLLVNDYKVEVVDLSYKKLNDIKQNLQIPKELWSCHTMILDRYTVEGHVPIIALNKLLKESPEINGIAVPGMPPGVPGMPGTPSKIIVYYYNNEEYGIFYVIE